MICEIINPSDALTLKTDDFIAAAIAVTILGDGKFGIQEIGGEKRCTPIIWGWTDWFIENGINELGSYIEQNRLLLAEILESVMLGNSKDREELDSMIAIIPKESIDEWILERNDRRRSSMNNIEGYAHSWAKKLRELDKLEKENEGSNT